MQGIDRFWHRTLKRPYLLAASAHVGKGETVVLLHGITANKELWAPLFTELKAAGKTIISLDLLGHGDSPRPTWIRYDVDDQTNAVQFTLRRLKVRGPITIVGHSMGCIIATHIAYKRPSHVSRLVLYEPPIFADLADYPKHSKKRNFYFKVFERIAANPGGAITLTKVLARLVANWAEFLESEATWLPIERSLRNCIMGQAVYRELHAISVPTAIVHGRFDMIVTRTDLEKMYANNPNVTFYMTIANHGLNQVSARFLGRIIAPELKARDTKRNKARRGSEGNLERSHYRGSK